MKTVALHATYRTRNGLTATVISTTEPGLRPVCAIVHGEGVPHKRYYTLTGHEHQPLSTEDPQEESPCDLTEQLTPATGAAAPNCEP